MGGGKVGEPCSAWDFEQGRGDLWQVNLAGHSREWIWQVFMARHFGGFIWRVILAHLFGGFPRVKKKQAVEQKKRNKEMYHQ